MTPQTSRDRQLEQLWDHIPICCQMTTVRLIKLLYILSLPPPCCRREHNPQEATDDPQYPPADRGP